MALGKPWVDGKQYKLNRPFFVIATQNPIELEGTYPLPFAQMDRFMIRLKIGYLNPEEECQMLKARVKRSPLDELRSVINCKELVRIQDEVRDIEIVDDLLKYIVDIVTKTRHADGLEFGASPRASLDLLRYSQATAYLNGRHYILPDDIKEAAPPVLGHRVIIKRGTRHGTLNTDDYINELIEEVEVPV